MTLLDLFFPEIYSTNNVSYNIVRKSESEFLLELNVSGLSDSDLDLETIDNKLVIKSNIPNDKREYLYKGFSTKPFKYTFNLRDDILVKSALVKNGILSICLELQLPEEKKPKKITIMH